MKFCSFSHRDVVRFGLVLPDDSIVDLPQAAESLLGAEKSLFDTPDLKSWLSQGAVAIESAREILKILEGGAKIDAGAVYGKDEVRLLSPIPNPGKIIAIGLNYRDHAEEQNVPLPKNPLIFAKFPSSLIGPDDEIRLPEISQKVDPEAEHVAVKGTVFFKLEDFTLNLSSGGKKSQFFKVGLTLVLLEEIGLSRVEALAPSGLHLTEESV